MIKNIIAVATCFALIGCGTKIITVTETKYIPVTIDTQLTEKFTLSTIVSKDVYMKSTDQERRRLLINMVTDSNALVASCNKRLFLIKEESDKLSAIVDKRNKDASKRN